MFLQVQNPTGVQFFTGGYHKACKRFCWLKHNDTSFDSLLHSQASTYCFGEKLWRLARVLSENFSTNFIRCSVRRSTNNGLLYQADSVSEDFGGHIRRSQYDMYRRPHWKQDTGIKRQNSDPHNIGGSGGSRCRGFQGQMCKILKKSGRCLSWFPNRQMCRILKISGRCLSRLFMCQMCKILKISCRCLSRLLTLPLNVTVSPDVLRWKGCPMQIGFSALASKKSVHIPIVLIYSFVSSR